MTRPASIVRLEISDDEQTLTALVSHGSCDELTPELREGPDEVVARVGWRSTLGPGELCDLVGRATPVELALAAPLGDRLLVVEGPVPAEGQDPGVPGVCVHRVGDRWCRPALERRGADLVPTGGLELAPSVAIPVEHAGGRTAFTATLSDGSRFLVDIPGTYDEIVQVERRDLVFDQERHWGHLLVHNLEVDRAGVDPPEDLRSVEARGWTLDAVLYVHPQVPDPEAERDRLVDAIEVGEPPAPGAAPAATSTVLGPRFDVLWILDGGLGLRFEPAPDCVDETYPDAPRCLAGSGYLYVDLYYQELGIPELAQLRRVGGDFVDPSAPDPEADALRAGAVITPLG